jgi:uncharacterized protein YbjT (DUF2867 family)
MNSDKERAAPCVLVTGATGYVGGRVVPLLEEQGFPVRCLTRNPQRLRGRVAPQTQVVRGDVNDAGSLGAALREVHTAYYLIHGMADTPEFAARDVQAARRFAAAARDAGVRRIIYLGGLGDERDDLSPHLRSRHEVGRVLRDSGVETVEFRAAVIVGAGSASFELVRALADRLPVVACPPWVMTPTQPIAIRDVLAYLLAALDLPPGASRVFEIGGRDVVRYRDLMDEYARQANLLRVFVPVPVFGDTLADAGLDLVAPDQADVGRHLIEGLRNATVVRDPSARRVFPVEPLGLHEAVHAALAESGPR